MIRERVKDAKNYVSAFVRLCPLWKDRGCRSSERQLAMQTASNRERSSDWSGDAKLRRLLLLNANEYHNPFSTLS